MRIITATELVRQARQVLDRLVIDGEEIIIERDNVQIARLVPGPARQTAAEALADLYGTLAEDAAAGWLEDSRNADLVDEIRDPWAY